jgi:hypothetical protein
MNSYVPMCQYLFGDPLVFTSKSQQSLKLRMFIVPLVDITGLSQRHVNDDEWFGVDGLWSML